MTFLILVSEECGVTNGVKSLKAQRAGGVPGQTEGHASERAALAEEGGRLHAF